MRIARRSLTASVGLTTTERGMSRPLAHVIGCCGLLLCADCVIAAMTMSWNQCEEKRQEIIERARALDAAKDPWQAHLALDECATRTQDPELVQLSNYYEAKDRRATANDKKVPTRIRIYAIERLEQLEPSSKTELEKLKTALQKQEAAAAAERRKQEAAAAAERKRRYDALPGVRIGMTREEVLGSKWGKPLDVYRTTTASGTSETWDYGGKNSLYFENGVLTQIHN
jgi:hypothetical protein